MTTATSASFRGAREASEPGIQMHIPYLFLDSGFALTARPGMTVERLERAASLAIRSLGCFKARGD
jgi:hypothetical protein